MPWIGGVLCLLVVTVAAGFYWSSSMRVQQVYYEGNDFVSREQLQEIAVPTGIHPDSLNTLDLIARFERIPYVKKATISVEPSGNLTIQISERQPIARLSEAGSERYIDQQGIQLPLKLGKTVNVPLLYGFDVRSAGDTLESAAFKATAGFLLQLQKRPVSDATISEVAWTDNGIVALTNQNGVKLIFGKEDFSTRLRNWEAFYSKVIKQKGIENMRSVDLRFKGQIVTREQ